MSKAGKLFLNQGNVQSELLRNPAIMNLVEAKAHEIAQAAADMSGIPDGYEVTVSAYGSTRSAARVTTATTHAYYENLKHNTLLKAKGRAQE